MNSKRMLLLVLSFLLVLSVFSCTKKTTEPEDQQLVATCSRDLRLCSEFE